MSKKVFMAAIAILTLLLIGIQFVEVVKANFAPMQRIYIKSDGTVNPENVSIKHVGNVYTISANILNNPLVVERSNIVLDGDGYTLDNSLGAATVPDWGIHLSNVNNVTLRNIAINNFAGGILFSNSNNNVVAGNTINMTYEGISLGNSYGNRIFQNNLLCRKYYATISSNEGNISNTNLWDNGKEGNFWSNYNGTDANGDGIGDNPYSINENNNDNYPLMNQVDIYNIEIIISSPSPTEQLTLEPTQTSSPINYGNQTLDLTPIFALSCVAVVAVAIVVLAYFKKKRAVP